MKQGVAKSLTRSGDIRVPLRQLTVLSGLNGSGKSTVLQTLGLLRQSLLASQQSVRLPSLQLRGPLVQLGVASDVVSDRASTSTISFILSCDEGEAEWAIDASRDGDILPIQYDALLPDPVEHYLRNCHFQFLQADRLTPQTHYERSDSISRDLGFLGTHGQFTPDYLAENGEWLEVREKRICPSNIPGMPSGLMERIVATPKLYDQISGWLQHISPGVRLEASRLSKTDLVTLRFSYESTEIARGSGQRRPSNVGFGLTYCLPVVTACLAAPPGGLLLLENPEAHLHPRGQVALGTLISKCADDGVQIIVETHSDHVLNGIRMAVKNGDISPEKVQLCNFNRHPVTGDTYIETPVVLANGELTAWPEGFFDEWEKSLETLLS
jgi:predicted ATPase